MVKHDIRADLVFNPQGAQRGFNQAAAGAQRVERSLVSAQGAADGLLRRVFAVGAAYLSLNTAVGVFARLTSSAFKYTASLEATKIGLSSVMSAVENVPWAQATKMAEGAFEKIKQMSIESPGSAQDMFGIFNGIVGPVRAAGASLQTVYDLTRDTTLTAAALGVDFQQASRDINMMARGTAGVDVKLFSLLKSTGAIKEDTEQWNKNLTAAERVEKLGAALKKFSGSGEAFGKSWAGVMSTFEGLTDELKRTTFQPLMRSIAATTDRLNTVMVKHAERIGYSFNHLGTSMARFWDSTAGRLDFDRVMLGVEAGVVGLGKAFQVASGWADSLVNNWGKLSSAISNSMPMLKVLAGVYLGHKLMGAAGGGALAAGAAGGGGGTVTQGGDIRGLFAKGQALGNGYLAGSKAGPVAGFAANQATSRMGYGGAAAASVAMPFLAPGFFLSAFMNQGRGKEVEAGGGEAGAVAGAGAGKFMALASSMSAALVVTEHWTRINAALGPVVAETEASTTQLAKSSARAGMAVGRIWGQLEVFGAGIMTSLAPAINTLSQSLAGILDHVTVWADKINYYLAPAFDYAISKLGEFASALSSFLAPVAKFFQLGPAHDWEKDTVPLDKPYELPTWAQGGMQAAKALSTPSERKPSVVNNVNASGARVTIKQEFGNQDPDRVVSMMMLDLERQAESRISSAFSGALTR